MLSCSVALNSCSAASSGVGKRVGRPARSRAIDSRAGPDSQRARSSSSAASAAQATITYGWSRYSEGWNRDR